MPLVKPSSQFGLHNPDGAFLGTYLNRSASTQGMLTAYYHHIQCGVTWEERRRLREAFHHMALKDKKEAATLAGFKVVEYELVQCP